MIKVKFFDNNVGFEAIEDRVNKFLEENDNDIEIVDMKYCVYDNIHYVMIMYREYKDLVERLV